MDTNYRTVALALRSYITDTYSLLDAADDVVHALRLDSLGVPPTPDDHEGLVALALRSPSVIIPLAQGKKISAIKALRTEVPGTSLVQAKNAVEDDRVDAFYVRGV